MWQQIRAGSWLTRERLRGYALILLAGPSRGSVIWIALADGLIDRNGKPIGTDFSNVWAAGTLVLDGRPAAPYDPVWQHAAEQEAFGGRPVPFFGWHYPPLFLIVAAGLHCLPYGWALVAWMAFTLSAYLAIIMHAILPRPETVLVALAFPAVLVNLGHGQNGFLTACAPGRRPSSPRPAADRSRSAHRPPRLQTAVRAADPACALATARWRVAAAATASVLAACAATLVLFGPEVWLAFPIPPTFTRVVVLEAGDTGWPKIQSLFSAVRMWGGGVDGLCCASRACACRRGEPGMAMALAGSRRAEVGCTPLCLPAQHTLRARLRSHAARRHHWVLHPLRARSWLPQLRDQPAGVCLGGAACRSQPRRRGRCASLGSITLLALYSLTLWRAAPLSRQRPRSRSAAPVVTAASRARWEAG